jgi:hypothetical protein
MAAVQEAEFLGERLQAFPAQEANRVQLRCAAGGLHLCAENKKKSRTLCVSLGSLCFPDLFYYFYLIFFSEDIKRIQDGGHGKVETRARALGRFLAGDQATPSTPPR